MKVLESIPRELLDSDFLPVVLPAANHFEDFGCQIVSVFLVPKHKLHKWIWPAADLYCRIGDCVGIVGG